MRVPRKDARGDTRRNGTILVLAAMVLVVLLGFVALAVDVGILAQARAQLKTVADSAALAGARQLASERRLSTTITNLDPEISEAKRLAIVAGNANKVLNNDMLLTNSNIVVGYKQVTSPNPDPPDSAVNTSVPATQFNSVQVTASVTVPALFSSVFGSTGKVVSVTSTATVELVKVGGFQSVNGSRPALLPIVIEKAAYDRMMRGETGDSYTFTSSNDNPPSPNGVSDGPDGVKESVAYPVKDGLSGNWGTINFGVSSNSTSILGAQIRYGMTVDQLSREYPSGIATVPHRFSANTGISAGIKDDLTSIIGKPVTVAIYNGSGGNGNNAWYDVSEFGSVRIVAVDLKGGEKYVVIQPAIGNDPSGIPSTGDPVSWSSGGMVFLHLSR